jgi:hypothetical protein
LARPIAPSRGVNATCTTKDRPKAVSVVLIGAE